MFNPKEFLVKLFKDVVLAPLGAALLGLVCSQAVIEWIAAKFFRPFFRAAYDVLYRVNPKLVDAIDKLLDAAAREWPPTEYP